MLQKLAFKPGITHESTSYANEGTWYDVDKVRFRFGHPEKIGGWTLFSSYTYQGVCRSLFNWVTLETENLLGVGTNLKFYLNLGGEYFDITPIRSVAILTDALYTVAGENRIYVYAPGSGVVTNDFIVVDGAVDINGIPASEIDGEHQITTYNEDIYYFTTTTAASAGTAVPTSVLVIYFINTGSAIYAANNGWGAGPWGRGSWGSGAALDPGQYIRLWSQTNYGQNLLFNPRAGGIYLWEKNTISFPRAINITDIAGTDGYAPVVANCIVVADAQLQLLVFGANPVDTEIQDPLLIRWGSLESPLTVWEITATSSAGDLRLSHGSRIVTAMQSRQEILTWTDTSLYSLQYVGQPDVWRASLLADNISIISPQAVSSANNVNFWMGTDKFYVYSGRVDTLICPVRSYVFNDINLNQGYQVFSGTNEGFNEVWWFYCSANSDVVDKYVVYNYAEQSWYYGTMERTAWLDSPLQNSPLAATYESVLVNHESGTDDGLTNPPSSIPNYIQSADYSIEQGEKFGFVWRLIPDVTFEGSSASEPSVMMTLEARDYPGSRYTPNVDDTRVTRTSSVPVEQYTNVVYVRVRGRQMALRIDNDQVGAAWKLGVPRADIRTDGKR